MALFFWFVPSLHVVIDALSSLGYAGIFLCGILYGSAITSTTASLIFIQTDHSLHPILVGLIGGLGAALYDTTIFLIFREESGHGWLARWLNRLRERRHIPNWVSMVVGGFVIASPFPDELASGLMGITNSKTVPFLAVSFAANTLGIIFLSRL